MSTRKLSQRTRTKWITPGIVAGVLCGFFIFASATADSTPPEGEASAPAWPTYTIAGPVQESYLYATGERVEVPSFEQWRLMCGSDPTNVTVEDVITAATTHHAILDEGPISVVNNSQPRDGLNVVLSIGGSVPAAAYDGLAMAESYLESMFADPITVTISVSFQFISDPSVIGYASSSYQDVSFSNSRNGMIAGMDSDDIIQSYLPTTSGIPVVFSDGGGTSYEYTIDWTRANYKSTIGSVAGTDAAITFNNQFDFDYDPSNGVLPTQTSFVDVCIHEFGHVLGFTSDVGDPGNNMDTLDIFRFDLFSMPSTYAEFQTVARHVYAGGFPFSSIVDGQWRMEGGIQYQASHFLEVNGSGWIGLMDPAFTDGETHYPDFYSEADLAMFDAIGWDYVAEGPIVLGDLNCDGFVSAADIDPFVTALTGGQAAYEALFPDCNFLNADTNEDGTVSAADIDPFVTILTGG
jgi:hypothetical protein